MAATRIISMHVNKGKTLAACLKDRTDYAKNLEKTDKGKLVNCYMRDAAIVDSQFLLSKKIYEQKTGRKQKNDVIAYQVRQA
ncbi:MAG: relaxase, partial [Bacilli bacterium]